MIGIDLFAGAGGMSLGAQLAGIDVQFAVENDPWACATYRCNHSSTSLHTGDIRRVNRRHLRPWLGDGRGLVLFGGPPCQGFSWSNLRTRSEQNDNNWLFTEFVRIARLLKPEWIVFENVQGFTNTKDGIFVDAVETEFSKLGYTTHSAKLNAMNYGVPQDRTRFFLVASRDARPFKFPKESKKLITVDEALRDLPKLGNGQSECWQRYGRKKPSPYGRRMRGNRKGCCNHLVTRNAEFVIERYAFVPQGGNWEDIPDSQMENYADRSRCHTGIYHRLVPSTPSIVIGNFRKNMLIHPTEDRGLSVREAARLQSFPDGYKFSGSIGFQQQQVGNAVPPQLARSVFKAVIFAAS